MTRPFQFGVMSFTAPSRAAWRDLAWKAEALGYATLVKADRYLGPFAPVPGLLAGAGWVQRALGPNRSSHTRSAGRHAGTSGVASVLSAQWRTPNDRHAATAHS